MLDPMPVNLPGGLGGLLAKLVGGQGKAEEGGDKATKGSAKGMKGKGVKKGEALGDEMLLAGMGFSEADKNKAQKNKAERQNVARFLQDPKAEMAKLKKTEGAEKEAAPDSDYEAYYFGVTLSGHSSDADFSMAQSEWEDARPVRFWNVDPFEELLLGVRIFHRPCHATYFFFVGGCLQVAMLSS